MSNWAGLGPCPNKTGLVDHFHQLGPHGPGDDGVLALLQGRLEDVPQR